MEIISLKSLKKRDSKSVMDRIFLLRGAKKITIVSAYIDKKSIEDIRAYCKETYKRPIVLQFFIDKVSCTNIQNDLFDIQTELDNDEFFDDDSGIYLVRYGKLFHSKLYWIENNKSAKILVGSMNFTQMGMLQNEEILAYSKVQKKDEITDFIEEYIQTLQNESERVTESSKNTGSSSIREFFLKGNLYCELKENNPFHFKLGLPKDFLKNKSIIDELLGESNESDSVSIQKLIEKVFRVDYLPVKINYKKYCIPTCFGYWAPISFFNEIEESIHDPNKQKRDYYDKVFGLIQTERDKLTNEFKEMCKRIRHKLRKEKLEEDWKDTDKLEYKWNNWYENLLEKIKQEKLRERLISGIGHISMPDFWNDCNSTIADEFENSFFEEVFHILSKETSKNTSKILVTRIWNSLKLYENDYNKPEDLKEMVEDWLENNPDKDLLGDSI
jgi:hypothetical protein